MSEHALHAHRRGSAGVASIILGVLGLASVGWGWFLTATTTYDPPNSIRIAGMAFLPIGLFGAVITGIRAVRSGQRATGWAGLALAGLIVVAFVVLVNAYE